MGSVWQALALGFAGLRPRQDGVLCMQPRLPAAWSALEVRVQFRGHAVRVRRERDELTLWSDGPVTVFLDDAEMTIERGTRLRRCRFPMGGQP